MENVNRILDKSCDSPATAQIILIMGQSNAEGNSHSKHLEENVGVEKAAEYLAGYEGIKISYINSELLNTSKYRFVPVRADQGYSTDRFGFEVGIAEKLSRASLSSIPYIIKYTYGGTAIKNEWRPPACGKDTGYLYKAAVNFVKTECEELRAQGLIPVIKAICWMQGESDAERPDYEDYKFLEGGLKRDLRDAFAEYKPDGAEIGFIDAGISDCTAWTEYKKVNAAKLALSLEDEYHDYIDTIAAGLPYLEEPIDEPDIYHYDCLGSIRLGHLFAEILLSKYLEI